MAVPGTAWQAPGTAVMAPPRAALEQDRATGHEREESGGTKPAPVPVTERAADPPVPVPASHSVRHPRRIARRPSADRVAGPPGLAGRARPRPGTRR